MPCRLVGFFVLAGASHHLIESWCRIRVVFTPFHRPTWVVGIDVQAALCC